MYSLYDHAEEVRRRHEYPVTGSAIVSLGQHEGTLPTDVCDSNCTISTCPLSDANWEGVMPK